MNKKILFSSILCGLFFRLLYQPTTKLKRSMIVNVINKSVKVSHKEQRLVLPIEALFGMVPVNLNFSQAQKMPIFMVMKLS